MIPESTPSAASIDLLRQPLGALRRLRGREIAMIFQEPMTALNPVMTIGRQVAEAAEAHFPSWTGRESRRKALAALESVSIPEAARRYGDYPHQFSGGQRQRILIAMALINRPRLLIADEPTTALDVTVQAQVLELLKDLQLQHGLAMLFISHDLAVVGQVASRVAVMRAGEVVETGPCSGCSPTRSIRIPGACWQRFPHCAPTEAGRWRWWTSVLRNARPSANREAGGCKWFELLGCDGLGGRGCDGRSLSSSLRPWLRPEPSPESARPLRGKA